MPKERHGIDARILASAQYRYSEPYVDLVRGYETVTVADLPHQLEVDAVDREIRIGTNRTIDWRGDRPDEQDLQSGDRLEWIDDDGVAQTTLLTRAGSGTPRNINVANADKPASTDTFVLVEERSHTVQVRRGVTNGEIVWVDGRPDSDYRESGALLWRTDVATPLQFGPITWADAGDTTTNPPAVAYFKYYEAPQSDHIFISTTGAVQWRGFRPTDTDDIVTSAQLRATNHDGGTNHGVITWNDAGDSVATPPASNSAYHDFQTLSVEITIAADQTITIAGTGAPNMVVGDRVSVTIGPVTSFFVIDSKTDDNTFTTSTDPHGQVASTFWHIQKRGAILRGFELWRQGVAFEGYQIRQTGFRIYNWQLYSDGSFYGKGGVPEDINPFLLVIADAGSNGQVVLIDADGNEHTWTGGSADDMFKVGGVPVAVQEVKHGTTITSFHAVYP